MGRPNSVDFFILKKGDRHQLEVTSIWCLSPFVNPVDFFILEFRCNTSSIRS